MTPSRRILLLNERDPEHPRAGGAEIHLTRIFSRLAARGHAITWLATGFAGAGSRARIDGLSIERRGPLPTYYASVPARVRAAETDLVIECLNKVPFYSPLYAKHPVLALCHHLFGEVAFDQVAFPIAAAVVLAESGLSRAYRDVPFLAISASTRDDLERRGIHPAHIAISPPGIDAPSLRVDPDHDRPPRLTYVGRLERYKRVDVMLRAGALLVERFPALEIFVIGRGPERVALEKHTRELGLEGRTRFTGFVDDRERDALLAGSRVCAFPSEKEGWGLTVIEANALGTPVVARDAPGLRDSIRHGETGWLVEDTSDRDPEFEARCYADALARVLAQDEATRTMRRACLAWSARFDWERAADDMEEAIERCLVDPRP